MIEDKNTMRRESRRNYQKRRSTKSHLGIKIVKWIFLIVLLLVVSGIGLFAFYAKDAPNINQDQLQSGGTSSLYNNDGKFLLSLGSEKRIYVKNKDIPQLLKDAVVSVEDKRFYKDKLGVDPIRIVGSMLTNAKSNSIAAGGSTITQQLVKLTVFSTAASQRTLKRKAQEAWLAVKVQHEFSKDQILEFYINKVFMNYGNYGMGTAANYYYGKSLKKLDLAQIALIAGMPNAPVAYDPYLYPQKAKYRRNIVLKTMLQNEKITKDEYNQAVNEPITHGLKKRRADNESKIRKIDDPYIKEVTSEVKSKGFDPYNDNLKITINIDQKAQNKLYELANNGSVPFTNNKMQIGATVIDPNNGHVVAILGGRHLPSVQLGLDRAVQTGRSTGSSIKPVLDYGPAIQYLNWSTAKMLDDSKYVYPGTNIQLYDWDNKYDGMMTMRKALEQSRNVPAVKTLADVGVKRASAFARRLGVNVPSNSGLSVAIGANASSLQMTGAYSAFATMGIYHKPQFVSKIETPDGLTRNYDSNGVRVMKKSTAYMITDMLKGVIKHGSGTNAKIPDLYQAGKTGTVKYSDEDLAKYPGYNSTPKDSWFVGYTRSYAIGIWTGYDNLKDGTISGIGQQSAQLMYKSMMTYLMRNKPNLNWQQPKSVIRAKTGGTWQLYVRGHAPAGVSDSAASYDEDDEETDTNNDTNNSVNTNNIQSSSSETGTPRQSSRVERSQSSQSHEQSSSSTTSHTQSSRPTRNEDNEEHEQSHADSDKN
ncbi:PBP1A family penicillin-binding protein [Lactobacillus helveticus]|uniref:Penicillin-binding protein 1A n=1 Tax=Lactobacillus helveticus TaxID=1587 RepID=A0A3S8S9R0_LACHE|nr:PBP1A family penicillin-binding protein [Lactobacillus helveticus]AFR21923.1 penicillin-binding protein 1A [Lactobacillus helveticus R0052]AZK90536.1 Penicillin-binding protein 1A [Lactobacillus helveticus]MCJ2189394.1 penicillin-binding protein [Lactobacillus helveticus]MED7627476.1 penicillin-binding protein [Lactobacillus helveticus]MZR04937.1 PBP1A family penicillin-binding protein [Lactobacillus helveticus]